MNKKAETAALRAGRHRMDCGGRSRLDSGRKRREHEGLPEVLFGAIFVFMTVMTVRTSLQVRCRPSRRAPWSRATLYDACCGFITFFLLGRVARAVAWAKDCVVYSDHGVRQHRRVLLRLIQLFGLKEEEGVSALFQQKMA